jgi:hypothetical protein
MYYKNVRGHAGEGYRLALAAILSGAYEQHASAIEGALGGPPNIVTTVPSTRVLHAVQPLQSVIQRVAALAERCGDTLEHSGVVRIPRTVQPSLFRTTGGVSGRRILLVEDLWVGGTTVESAIRPLQTSGAIVAALAIGRQIKLSFQTAPELLAAVRAPNWW